jgi:hypothetical protein
MYTLVAIEGSLLRLLHLKPGFPSTLPHGISNYPFVGLEGKLTPPPNHCRVRAWVGYQTSQPGKVRDSQAGASWGSLESSRLGRAIFGQ